MVGEGHGTVAFTLEVGGGILRRGLRARDERMSGDFFIGDRATCGGCVRARVMRPTPYNYRSLKGLAGDQTGTSIYITIKEKEVQGQSKSKNVKQK